MANGVPHDWVDMVGSFGPTLATVFAGVATIAVYRRGEKFQRQLVRPLVVVRHRLNHGHESTLWNVSVRNEGQGAANIEAFGVMADGYPSKPGPLQNPGNYWEQAMNAVGIIRVRSVAGFWLEPPVSLAPGAEEQLFEADLAGNGPDVAQGIRQLQFRLAGQSALGERFAIHSSYGHTESATGRRARRMPV